MKKVIGYSGAALVSGALIVGAASHWVPLDLTEVLGFISGGLCVWLTVGQNIWNWPIGIANNVFFILLFLQSRLFGDMGLQVVYIVLGILGWYWWLRGGPSKTELLVARLSMQTTGILAILLVVCAVGVTMILQRTDDSAPLWDALTTVMSLIAQYMLTRKLIENWYVWITADVIYVALYAYKHLYLTSGLYAIFIVMCICGLVQWRASLAQQPSARHESRLEPARV